MITSLDHFVLLCPEIEAATADYHTLLGEDPVWRAETADTASTVFAVGNTAIELLAPNGEGEIAQKLREMTKDGAQLTSLVYRSDDINQDRHDMSRRGLSPDDISDGASTNEDTGAERTWQRFRIPDAQMAGIKTFVLQTETPIVAAHPSPGSVSALDHLVINTPNPERAVANYGARLGVRFALDRTAEQWKTRFLFFRLGGLTLEVINRLGTDQDMNDPDQIWGLTWEADDLKAAHARLQDAGLDVSEIRTGRKPGSEVFTVRNGTQGVPTLFIAHSSR
jgi:catechol 2,3-dioxygenase-like lactoylglutathione lyase family enzyme